MSTSLAALIRLRRWRLDEERRSLADALAALRALEEQAASLEAEVRAEQQHAAADPAVAGAVYGPYARASVARRAHLREAVAQAEDEVSRQRERVQVSWRELRTLELTEEARCRRLAEEAERRDRLTLDETATSVWRRQQPPAPDLA